MRYLIRDLHVTSADLGVLLDLGVALDYDPKTREIRGGWAVAYTATLAGRPVRATVADPCPCRALALARCGAMSAVFAELGGEQVAHLAQHGIAPRWRQPTFEV